MAAFELSEESKPPEKSNKYEKVKNPWRNSPSGKSEYYYRKKSDDTRRSTFKSEALSKSQRQSVLDRDEHRCQNCGDGGDSHLEVHHIVPRMVGGSNNKTNLITLCQKCHNQVQHPNQGSSKCCSDTDNNKISDFVNRVVNRVDGWATECQNCGKENPSTGEIELHYIVPTKEGERTDKGNTAFLCSRCHSAAHGKRTYAQLF